MEYIAIYDQKRAVLSETQVQQMMVFCLYGFYVHSKCSLSATSAYFFVLSRAGGADQAPLDQVEKFLDNKNAEVPLHRDPLPRLGMRLDQAATFVSDVLLFTAHNNSAVH